MHFVKHTLKAEWKIDCIDKSRLHFVEYAETNHDNHIETDVFDLAVYTWIKKKRNTRYRIYYIITVNKITNLRYQYIIHTINIITSNMSDLGKTTRHSTF